MKNQTENNKLNYLIDTSVEIKDFNVLIYCERFFETPVKKDEEIYEQIIDLSKNNH